MRKNKRKLKRWVRISLLAILLSLVILAGYMLFITTRKPADVSGRVIRNTTKAKVKNDDETGEISMVMVGDCLIHRMVYTDAKTDDNAYSFSKMFKQVKPLIGGHDLAYYNQESIIGGKRLGLSAYPRFNSPEEIGDDMLDLGFNLVSLVNNHTMDKGEKGVINSVNYWKTKPGVYYTGQALSEEERNDNIKVKELNGIKYAFLAYTTQTNGLLPPAGKEYLTNIYSEQQVKNDVDIIKDKVDLIIVAMHWGEEYQTSENANQRKIAKYLSSLGVNLIIGAHPHVLQPVERIDDTLVFYSLGNFISAQDTDDKLTGAIASVNIKKDDNKIIISDAKIDLIYTSYKYSLPYNFVIYPYHNINSQVLPNYKTYYEKYKNILTKYDKSIEVVSLNNGN